MRSYFLVALLIGATTAVKIQLKQVGASPEEPGPIAAEEPSLAPEEVGPVSGSADAATKKTSAQIIDEIGMPEEAKEKLSALDCAED